MSYSGCETCKFKGKYDENPKSFLGRLWRWHIKFCPGWRSYMKSLDNEKREAIAKHYHIVL